MAKRAPHPDIERNRQGVLAGVRPENIHRLEEEELLRLQERAGFGTKWGEVNIPRGWMPRGKGGVTTTGSRINFLTGLMHLPVAARDAAVLALHRLSVLFFVVPAGTHLRRSLPAMSTYSTWLYSAKTLLAAGAAKDASGTTVLQHLTQSDLVGYSAPVTKRLGIMVSRIQDLSAQGYWSDVPAFESNLEFERSRREQDLAVKAAKLERPHEPFSDDFVAEAGWRVCWMMDTLAAPLLQCAQLLAPIVSAELHSPALSTRKVLRQKAARKFLTAFEWRSSTGELIESLPFKVTDRKGRHGPMPVWPPRTVGHVRRLLSMLQFAHLYVFFLSTGARASEALSVDVSTLVIDVEKESVESQTYKLVTVVGGVRREWPLGERAARALSQQEDLKSALLSLPMTGSEKNQMPAVAHGLWVRPRGGGDLDAAMSALLSKSVKSLELEHLLGTMTMRSHRFRKSLARLGALALVGAPKILMDLFGHQTIEMTLHYILADPQLRAEIQEVARAQTVMFAVDAILDHQANGGAAAAKVCAVVQAETAKLGAQLGSSDIRELAEILTFGGRSWQLVREGVICTKTHSESGPCSRRLGVPEPSRCRSTCSHRLERAFLRHDVDRLLSVAAEQLDSAKRSGDDILAEEWRGQILANLRRFPDLKLKWLKNPTIAEVWADEGVEA